MWHARYVKQSLAFKPTKFLIFALSSWNLTSQLQNVLCRSEWKLYMTLFPSKSWLRKSEAAIPLQSTSPHPPENILSKWVATCQIKQSTAKHFPIQSWFSVCCHEENLPSMGAALNRGVITLNTFLWPLHDMFTSPRSTVCPTPSQNCLPVFHHAELEGCTWVSFFSPLIYFSSERALIEEPMISDLRQYFSGCVTSVHHYYACFPPHACPLLIYLFYCWC